MASLWSVLALFVASEAVADIKNVHHKRNHSATSDAVLKNMRRIEDHLAERAQENKEQMGGRLLVNGPLPDDFSERFSQAVARAAHVGADDVRITGSHAVADQQDVIEVAFLASPEVVKLVENEAAEPNSDLADGILHSFLVSEDDGADEKTAVDQESRKATPPTFPVRDPEATPIEDKGIDIDTELPYGDLEPFGREDTAQELTENAVTESDAMVDQLERAEVAEEKRSVFRALTRLRGAAITSFDGVARAQTGNIDEYNKVHKWRKTHPMHHLADEESDITKWAFPSDADLIQVSHKR
jgi:hypothetical protein